MFLQWSVINKHLVFSNWQKLMLAATLIVVSVKNRDSWLFYKDFENNQCPAVDLMFKIFLKKDSNLIFEIDFTVYKLYCL